MSSSDDRGSSSVVVDGSVDIKANQSNDAHPFNTMNDDFKNSNNEQTTVCLHVRLIRFFDEDFGS